MNDNVQKDVFPFFRILLENIVLIIIITILSTVAGTVVGFFKDKPVYTARTSMIMKISIYTQASNTPSTDISTTDNYFDTITKIIEAPDTISKARKISGDNGISASAVNVRNNDGSLVFTVSYTASSKEVAVKRLGHVINATKQIIVEKDLPVNDIQLIDLQREYNVSSSTNLKRYVLLGFVSGLVISVVVAMIIYLTDNTFHTAEELEEATNSLVIAYINKE
jgi:capsular polysaccharide biosynthesis protein